METQTMELAVVTEQTAIAAYGFGIEAALERIATEARAQTVDISTKAGREACASLAYKVARSKTLIDDTGKKLGEDARKKIEAINADRKKAREFLDGLRDEVRKPLTDWEQADVQRITLHESKLRGIVDSGRFAADNWANLSPEQLSDLRQRRDEMLSDLYNWEEFSLRAKHETSVVAATITNALERRQKHDTEQAELSRLRKEEEDRKKRARDEAIARQAAETARLEAERQAALAAKLESERVANEARLADEVAAEKIRKAREQAEVSEQQRIASELTYKRAAEKAESDRIAAQKKADEDQRLAVEAEGRRIAAAVKATDAAAQREADLKHRAKINKAAMQALVSIGLTELVAQSVIVAICIGNIPNLKVVY